MDQIVTVNIIRHGMVDNPNKIFYGRMPGFKLSEIGIAQAKQLGEDLTRQKIASSIDAVFTSPQQRAKETGNFILEGMKSVDELVFQKLSKNVMVHDQFDEVNSPFQGASLSYMESIGWELYNTSKMCELLKLEDPPPFESFEQVVERTVSGIRNVVEKAREKGYKSVLVTSHGDVCLASLFWGKGKPPSHRNSFLLETPDDYPSYCSVISLEINGLGECVKVVHQPGKRTDSKRV